jgi:hypothetical protein
MCGLARRACSDGAVDARREETSLADRRPVQIDDVEHLAGAAAVGEAVGVERRDVGCAADRPNPLIEIRAAVEAVACRRYRFGRVDQRRCPDALCEENRADEAGMIGFDGKEPGRRFEEDPARDQRRGALIGGDADIFEYVGAEQKFSSFA